MTPLAIIVLVGWFTTLWSVAASGGKTSASFPTWVAFIGSIALAILVLVR